jgi:C1A family cysteine protease
MIDLSQGVLVRDQAATSACVGFAITAAAEIAVDHKVRFSPVAAYTMARLLARSTWEEPLRDDGAFPLLATQALQKHGFVTDQDIGVNEELPLDLLEDGVTHKLSQYSRIPSGVGAYESLRRTLAHGSPVTLAISVDVGFEYTDGRVPVGVPMGSSRGSHYVCAVGYDSRGVRILNSWGKDWGDAGFAWLSPERVEDPTTLDLQAIELVQVGEWTTRRSSGARWPRDLVRTGSRAFSDGSSPPSLR